jgi:hypothetical protein
MSRKKGPPMITIGNEACIEKMSDCEVQEVLHDLGCQILYFAVGLDHLLNPEGFKNVTY